METLAKNILSTKLDKTKWTSILTIVGSICTLVFNLITKIF